MSSTITGIPRVKMKREHKARPIEPTAKRPDVKKKSRKRQDEDEFDDLDNAWRTR